MIAESILVVGVLTYTATWLLVPRPDATLRVTGTEADPLVLRLLDGAGIGANGSTFRQFQPYHGIDVWYFEHSVRPWECLVVLDSGHSGRFDSRCDPRGAELILHQWVGDGFADWLPDGSVVSFHLRDDTVAVFLHPPPTDP